MITSTFLNQIANFTVDKIQKVVINATYEITSFQKKQTDSNVAILEYIVPKGAVNTIAQIDLRDSNNNTLTSNIVNIPITTDVLIMQVVNINEKE